MYETLEFRHDPDYTVLPCQVVPEGTDSFHTTFVDRDAKGQLYLKAYTCDTEGGAGYPCKLTKEIEDELTEKVNQLDKIACLDDTVRVSLRDGITTVTEDGTNCIVIKFSRLGLSKFEERWLSGDYVANFCRGESGRLLFVDLTR